MISMAARRQSVFMETNFKCFSWTVVLFLQGVRLCLFAEGKMSSKVGGQSKVFVYQKLFLHIARTFHAFYTIKGQ